VEEKNNLTRQSAFVIPKTLLPIDSFSKLKKLAWLLPKYPDLMVSNRPWEITQQQY